MLNKNIKKMNKKQKIKYYWDCHKNDIMGWVGTIAFVLVLLAIPIGGVIWCLVISL